MKCARCNRSNNSKFKCCIKCREEMRTRDRNKRARRKQNGQCMRCGSPASGGSRCEVCSTAHNKYSRNGYPPRAANHRARLATLQKSRRTAVIAGYGGKCICCLITTREFLTVDHVNGLHGGRDGQLYRKLIEQEFPGGYQLLCANCNQGKQLNGGECPAHGMVLGSIKGGPTSQKQSEIWRRKWRLKQKQEVFAHYGPCRCCGEDELAFLAVDHIYDNGSSHRKSIGGGGATLHRWLINNEFPEGFQPLCFNCNVGKRLNGGICPKHLINLTVPVGITT
jgi:hypothetical protein